MRCLLWATLTALSTCIYFLPQIHADAGDVYFYDAAGGIIYKAPLEPGAGAIPFLSSPTINLPSAVAVDSLNRRLYWAESVPPAIWRANLDGSNPEFVLPTAEVVNALFIDWAFGKLYWTEGTSSGSLNRSNLNGTGFEPLVVDLITPTGLDVDVANQTVYVADIGLGLLFRYLLASNTIDPLIGAIMPVTVSVNSVTQTLYWHDLGSQQIFSSALDGTNAQPFLFAQVPSGAQCMAIDANATPPKLYLLADITPPQMVSFIQRTTFTSPSLELVQSLLGEGFITTFSLDTPCSPGFRDSDADGFPDCLDECMLDGLKGTPGVCGCGVADFDSDLDGTPDCVDVCALDSTKVIPGLCGCNVPELALDSDGDQLIDCFDACPFDPTKLLPEICGCGEFPFQLLDGSVSCNAGSIVTATTQLDPPQVQVRGKSVTIFFTSFTGVSDGTTLESTGQSLVLDYFKEVLAAKRGSGKLKVKYQVQLKPKGKGVSARDIQARSTKRSQITYRNVTPGNYSARYRVVISRGSKKVAQTKYSPRTNFTVR